MLCLAFFSVEAQVSDVHDGDATGVELRRDGSSRGGAQIAHVDAAGRQEAGQAATHHDAAGQSTGDNGQPVHTQHVCHCVHAHGVVDAGCGVSGVAGLPDASAPAGPPLRMPPSLGREPQFRPPIAA